MADSQNTRVRYESNTTFSLKPKLLQSGSTSRNRSTSPVARHSLHSSTQDVMAPYRMPSRTVMQPATIPEMPQHMISGSMTQDPTSMIYNPRMYGIHPFAMAVSSSMNTPSRQRSVAGLSITDDFLPQQAQSRRRSESRRSRSKRDVDLDEDRYEDREEYRDRRDRSGSRAYDRDYQPGRTSSRLKLRIERNREHDIGVERRYERYFEDGVEVDVDDHKDRRRRGSDRSIDDDNVDAVKRPNSRTFVCTCTKTSSGLQVGDYTIQPEDLEDLFVLKRTGERRKKKKKEKPPPPPTGIFSYLASLVGGKARPPAEPSSSEESEYDSEYELKRLDRKQIEHWWKQIDLKQFLQESEDMKEPLRVDVPVVFVFGGPGSGKGTQCTKIVKKYDFTHISSGDLLREEVQAGSDKGKEINEIMKKGELVPLDVVLQLLKEGIRKQLATAKGYLIDGYPRNVEQGERFEKEVCKCTDLVYFEVTDETMTKRLLARGQTSGRVDDNEETIKNRIKTFRDESEPVIEKYKAIVHKISAEEDEEKVFQMVVPVFDKIVESKATTK
ncbi:hypothetical protein HPB47_007899 [Ixodes persulcatus]|uniref:Uncharacterized protein n=1 Tax=Ixodes persulcatus TaxID=34615 RepID=A0AC60P652_IXOPE|nr:hypothetical protein HPB47_007899 [Ixodes persulcatus]